MQIVIFGGFLGSGKTTLVQAFLHGIIEHGQTAAVIENEIGEAGLDQALLEETGIRITPLFGGCVCCTLAGDLLTTSQKINDTIHPDWLVIETTGFAVVRTLLDVFEKYDETKSPVCAVTVVDSTRWEKMYGVTPYLMEGQLNGACALLITKIDVQPAQESLLQKLTELAPQTPVIPVCAKQVSGNELYEKLAPYVKRSEAKGE